MKHHHGIHLQIKQYMATILQQLKPQLNNKKHIQMVILNYGHMQQI